MPVTIPKRQLHAFLSTPAGALRRQPSPNARCAPSSTFCETSSSARTAFAEPSSPTAESYAATSFTRPAETPSAATMDYDMLGMDAVDGIQVKIREVSLARRSPPSSSRALATDTTRASRRPTTPLSTSCSRMSTSPSPTPCAG